MTDDTKIIPAGRDDVRPTLKTIARMAGLAVPTVSRALNDAPDIGDATKARVREIANDLGYQPNRAGLRLRTGKTNVIALILSTEHDMMNHTARLINSIAAATRGTSYHMIITPYFPDEDPMVPIRYVTETRSADGVIFNQTRPEDSRVDYLMRTGFPFATHGRTVWAKQHPYFDFDNGVFGRHCVRKLVERGRKSIAMIAPRQDQAYAMAMIENAAAEAKSLGVKFTVLDDVNSDMVLSNVEAGLSRYIAGASDLDGLISASTNSAMAAVAAFEGNGLTIGTDVDLISKEALPFLQQVREGILVVNEDVAKAGDFLCRAVMQAIDRPDLPPMQFLEIPDGG